MKSIFIDTPAKINFGLNVIEKRDDGYHNIQTIYYPINLFDTLKFTPATHDSFITNAPVLKSIKKNLILTAKDNFESYVSKKFLLKIELIKRIPIGAGLGGGSSDAAATLKVLNRISGNLLTEPELFELAIRIGSDVAYFLNPKVFYATAKGELLIPIKFKISDFILLVNPKIHISTSWAYSKISPSLPKFQLKSINNKIFKHKDVIKKKIMNGFEEVIFKQHPEIRRLKESLYKSGAYFALMSGSGSTVFALFEDSNTVKDTQRRLKKKYFTFLQ